MITIKRETVGKNGEWPILRVYTPYGTAKASPTSGHIYAADDTFWEKESAMGTDISQRTYETLQRRGRDGERCGCGHHQFCTGRAHYELETESWAYHIGEGPKRVDYMPLCERCTTEWLIVYSHHNGEGVNCRATGVRVAGHPATLAKLDGWAPNRVSQGGAHYIITRAGLKLA
jgi:hypothetical protein